MNYNIKYFIDDVVTTIKVEDIGEILYSSGLIEFRDSKRRVKFIVNLLSFIGALEIV